MICFGFEMEKRDVFREMEKWRIKSWWILKKNKKFDECWHGLKFCLMGAWDNTTGVRIGSSTE